MEKPSKLVELMKNFWADPNPVFIDFETQSGANIVETGGRLYALHPSTRVLILSTLIDGTFHVWIPPHIKYNSAAISANRLWPKELAPSKPVTLHRNPDTIIELVKGRTLVSHNAYGFDKYIWNRFLPSRHDWVDTLYLSRCAGLPGALDKLAKQVIGVGKNRAKSLMPALCFAKPGLWGNGWQYPQIKAGDLQAFTRYAVADVELMFRLWESFDNLSVEQDVIGAHLATNERGIQVDIPLLQFIESVSQYAVNTAADDIAEMTKGKIPPDKLRSTKVVHEWLDSYGVYITDEGNLDDSGSAKKSLRKDIVQRYIDSPYIIESNLSAVREIPPIVVDVLKLRMKALRITDAKVRRAQERVESNGRIHDLISYHVASTGRFSSNGVQIHNLPRPMKGLDMEGLIQVIQSITSNDDKVKFDTIKTWLKSQQKSGILPASTSVDDLCSALIRPCFVAKEKHSFIIADYASIEARGLAGIADETKLINLFRNHGDPYIQFAAQVYGIPESDVTKDQRQVGKVGILGLGYGMGENKLRIFAANSGLDLEKAGISAGYMVDSYRDTYTRITGWKPDKSNALASYRVGGLWKDLGKAVMETVGTGTVTGAGRCTFYLERNSLCCQLPSGRVLYYPEARIEDVVPPYCFTMNLPLTPKATVLYTSARGVKSLFGGLIAENIVQAISRDILAIALVKLHKKGFRPVLHVHDEIVCEVETSKANAQLRAMMEIMVEIPQWAKDWFPIATEGYVSPRFVKEPWKNYLKLNSKNF